MRTARNRAIDRLRRDRRYAEKVQELELLMPEEPADTSLPDDRLRLFFTCCHPRSPRKRASRSHSARSGA